MVEKSGGLLSAAKRQELSLYYNIRYWHQQEINIEKNMKSGRSVIMMVFPMKVTEGMNPSIQIC